MKAESRCDRRILVLGMFVLVPYFPCYMYTVFLRLYDGVFFLPKQSKRSRSVSQDGSRSFGLFRKGKIGIIAKFHRTDLVI